MIRIDPNVTELPEPIPWVRVLAIGAAGIIAKHLESGDAEGMKNEMACFIDDVERMCSADCLEFSGDAAVQD